MVFRWSLSDSKFPQVSRTLLSILAVLSNDVIWIISTCPPTFKSPRPFNNPLVIVLKEPITIGTIITFMFHTIFNSLARSRYLSFFFTFFQSYSVVSRDSKVDNLANSLFFFFFVVDFYQVWPRLGDRRVCQYPILLSLLLLIVT